MVLSKVLLPIVMLAFLLTPNVAHGTSSGDVTVIVKKTPKDPNPSKEQDPRGNRSPSFSIPCTISIENGIECDMIQDDVLSYQIWDEEEICCHGSFLNEEDFVMHLFSFPGDYLIKLETLDYYYYGFVSIY